jgi:MYXO-CTERM domain-containing protein
MRHLSSLVSSSAFAAFVAFFSSSAAAHIELVEPLPRYELPANKSCPCGDGDMNRSCNVPASESTDPNRSTNVTTFEAGSTITVVAEEYIDHAGRMRVAFDPEGADLSDFNDNILMDVADPGEAGLSTTNPRVWEFQVRLPEMTCDNCTLQVVQVMNNNTTTEVADPAEFSTYYACADIRLVAAGSLNEGGGSGGSANAGEAGGPSSGGAAGSGGAAAGSGGATGGAAGSTMGTAGSGTAASGIADDGDEEDDSGCAFRASENSSAAGWALALLGLAAALRRRQR